MVKSVKMVEPKIKEIQKQPLNYFKTPIPTFSFEQLIGRTLKVRQFTDNNTKLIIAKDITSKEMFVLQQID